MKPFGNSSLHFYPRKEFGGSFRPLQFFRRAVIIRRRVWAVLPLIEVQDGYSMRKLLLLVLLHLALFNQYPPASACSCVRPAPPCKAFRVASAVFVGSVTGASVVSVEQEVVAIGKGREKITYQEKVFRFSLEHVYKGVEGLETQVQTGPALGGDCGYPFENGERYLVYADRDSKTGMLHTSICSRTAAVSMASDDLDFLRGLPESALKSRISGTVSRYTNENDKAGFRTIQLLSSVRVIVSGQGKRYEAVTNNDGVYQLVGLPPGSYKVEADLPGNLSHPTRSVNLAQGDCAQADILTESSGGISGRIVDNEGNPVVGIRLDLIPVDVIDLINASRRVMLSHSESTDKEGRYKFENIPPGKYYFGFDLVYETRTDYPYPRTYFPGASDRAQATVLNLGDGERLTGVDLSLLPRIPIRTIRGVLLWPDGRPVSRAQILLKDAADIEKDYRIYATAEVDEKGQFSIKGFEGVECWLHAWTMEGIRFLRAEPVKIQVDNGIQSVRLTIKEQDSRTQEKQSKKPLRRREARRRNEHSRVLGSQVVDVGRFRCAVAALGLR